MFDEANLAFLDRTDEIFYNIDLTPKQYVKKPVFIYSGTESETSRPLSQDSLGSNIHNLMQYSLWIAQNIGYKLNQETDAFGWAFMMQNGLFEENNCNCESYQAFFTENTQLFVPSLVGNLLVSYFIENPNEKWTEALSEPFEFRLNFGLYLIKALSEMHFSESNNVLVNKLYNQFLAINKDIFIEDLAYYLSSLGLPTDTWQLRAKREGDFFNVSYIGQNDVLSVYQQVPEPVIGLNSITGIDGSGKSTVMRDLPYEKLQAAYPEQLAIHAANLSEDEAFLNQSDIYGELSLLLRKEHLYPELQHLLTSVRRLLYDHTGTANLVRLSPYQGFIMERNLFCNLAYANSPKDFVLKFAVEFGGQSLLPEKIFILRTKIATVVERLDRRDDRDHFDEGEAGIHMDRMFRYLLLAKLLPEYVQVISTYDEDTRDLLDPKDIANGILQKINTV